MAAIGLCAASVGVVAAASAIRGAHGERLKDGRLPEALKEQGGEKMIAAIAVHVRRVEMERRCHDQKFTIQVKYGAKRSCLKCQTPSFSPQILGQPAVSRLVLHRSAPPASAEVDSLCLFLLYEPIVPSVRLSLRRASRRGFRTCTIARTSASIEHLSERRVVELPLRGDGKDEIGRVSVAFETLWVRQQDLVRSLTLAGAQQQKDAYLISVGSLVDESSDSSESNNAQLEASGLSPPTAHAVQLHM